MGLEPFRRLLNDKRFTHCAFIAETPVDEPEDDRRNVETMLALVQKTTPAKLRRARSPAK
jgi:deoxyribonuclease-4